MPITMHRSLFLASIAVFVLLSTSAHAATPGGCTGTAQYYNGRFLGYTISNTDPIIGFWAGVGFGNHVVDPVSHVSAPNTGVSTYLIKNDGRYVGSGWSSIPQGEYEGTVYCLAYGKAYVAWNDQGLPKGNGYVVTLNKARDIAFIKDIIASSSPDNSSHEMNAIVRIPPSVNMTDVARVLDAALPN